MQIGSARVRSRLLSAFISLIVILGSTGVQWNRESDDNAIDDGRTSGWNDSSSEAENVSSSSHAQSRSTTTRLASSVASTRSFIDQINSYRNSEIVARVKQCDASMKLNQLCERYSIDSATDQLIRQLNIPFTTLETIYDSLVNRTVVGRLNEFCLPARWCLSNLSQDDIEFTSSVLRERGNAFCGLEGCRARLLLYIETCPALVQTNISTPTLQLLPMLCALHRQRYSWNSTGCEEEIVRLFHTIYAFWSPFEVCYDERLASSRGCALECQMFDKIFEQLENQCSRNGSFAARIPALASYLAVKQQRICRQSSLLQKLPLMSSVRQIFSPTIFTRRSKDNVLYAILFLILLLCLLLSCSLCLCSKRKRRRFGDEYEYARLQHTSFELGSHTEISDSTCAVNDLTDDESPSEFVPSHSRVAEYQRLLRVES